MGGATEQTGDVLAGRYRLEERIASGGMGVVWRARDELLERAVAVKMIHGALADDEHAVERLRREALTAAAVSHPNMANVFDYVDDAERPGIVMELLDPGTLAQRLERDGALSIRESLRIADGVLAALGAAHDVGIVHRDVKPANILLGSSGRVKVTDFGIARMSERTAITQSGTVMGTAHYAAPEQVRGQPATPASDIYATGVVLYEMLAGVRPFAGDTPLAAAMARLSEQPPPVREHRREVGAELDAVVMRALATRPEDRFASVMDMRRAIRAAIAAERTPERGVAIATAGARAAGTGTAVMPLATAPTERVPQAPPTTAPLPTERPLRRTLAILLLPALATAAITAGVVALVNAGDSTRASPAPVPTPSEPVTSAAPSCCAVPNVIGMTRFEASEALAAAGLGVGAVTFHATHEVPEGRVVSQEPDDAATAQEGDDVDLVLARTPAEEPRKKRGRSDDD